MSQRSDQKRDYELINHMPSTIGFYTLDFRCVCFLALVFERGYIIRRLTYTKLYKINYDRKFYDLMNL